MTPQDPSNQGGDPQDPSGKFAAGVVIGRRGRRRAIGASHSGMVAGTVLVTIGTILLGEQMRWGHNWNMGRLWPLILIAVGVGRVLGNPRCIGSAVWLIGIGVLFLLNQFHVLMIHQAWPLFFILGGLWIVFSGRRSSGSNGDAPPGGVR